MSTDLDADPGEITVETAYARSDSHAFDGIDLQPFSPQRCAAAMACGMAYGTQDQTDGLVQVGTDKEGLPTYVYRKLPFDTALVLYLCSVEPKQVRLAFRNSDSVIEKAMEFADAHGLLPLSEKLNEATAVFGAIVADLAASSSTPKFKTNGETADPN